MDREIPTSHENQPSEEPSPNDTAEELSPGADEPPPDADEPSPGADKPSPGADEPSPGADKPSPDEESIEDLFRQLQGERDESDESEPDLDASLTNQVQNHKTDYEDKQWRIGDWVLAEYKGMYYPGIVKQIVGDETEIDCLEKAGKFWKWPDPADLLWYESHKVVRTLSAPFPISNRGQFKFAAEL
ncbi:uncharacterized protein [Amphiura filiformis]|uniref:uncharacterized protein n=1 Tax=Amphiura filiformis TaxID=82378 RepID=UPI003B228342